MILELLQERHRQVEQADAAAYAARTARDLLIVELMTGGKVTAYRIAKTLGLTEGAIRKIVKIHETRVSIHNINAEVHVQARDRSVSD